MAFSVRPIEPRVNLIYPEFPPFHHWLIPSQARLIGSVVLAVMLAICGPLFCRFPNLSSTPLPQDMEDFHFCVESSRLYDNNHCCGGGDKCRCCCYCRCCRCSSRVRRMDYWSWFAVTLSFAVLRYLSFLFFTFNSLFLVTCWRVHTPHYK